MKFYCESGKHLLFDSEVKRGCGYCADIERLIAVQRVMPNELKLCREHRTNVQPTCISCQFSLDWNVGRRYCIRCGEPAIGYRCLSFDVPIEFFCAEHWEDVPSKLTTSKQEISG